MTNNVRSTIGRLQTLGEILRSLRENRKLLLREVAAAIAIDPTLLSKIERDERTPTKEQVKALAEFYKEENRNIIVAWLSDKLVNEIQNEDLAIQALKAAEKKIELLKKNRIQ